MASPNLRLEPIEPNDTLPFEDTALDVVVSPQVAENTRGVLRHFWLLKQRVLKPGGALP